MGYRKLLKGYLAHVNDTVGSDLVELAAQKDAFKPRDLGELRSIAAELKREGCPALEKTLEKSDTPTHHNQLVFSHRPWFRRPYIQPRHQP